MANSFNAANMIGAQDQKFQRKYNYLIQLIDERLEMLSAAIGSGVTIVDGVLTIGTASTSTDGLLLSADWNTFNNKQNQSNELDALSALADTAGFVKKTGDGTYSIDISSYQPLGNELTALQALADTAGFVKKTGDGAYSIDTNIYATKVDAIVYAIALG